MTDERLGGNLWSAIERLPDDDAGIVFRHYLTPRAERMALARQVALLCHRRKIVLALAGDPDLAGELGAALLHNPSAPTEFPFSLSVHSMEDAEDARSRGAALVFVSPVHATRSHPDHVPLGPARAAVIAKAAGVPAIALGGMNADLFAELPKGVFTGWAGIDAWLGELN